LETDPEIPKDEVISDANSIKLLETDPEIPRDEVISDANSIKPTILISSSLHLGLDLKDESKYPT
jgi:hypothetical protein